MFVLAVAALLLSGGCSYKQSYNTAVQALDKLHADYNAQRFDQIFADTSEEWRRKSDAQSSRKFIAGLPKKLGDAGNWKVAGWRVNVTPSGTFVNLQCQTSFARGEANEAFTWRVGKARS